MGEGYVHDNLKICEACDFDHEIVTPSFSLGAPSGLAGGAGGGGIAFAGITDEHDTDGGMAAGIGYGDPNKIGGLVSLTIGSVNPVDGGSFNRGAINISAGHNFKEHLLGVSVGVDDISIWHANSNDHDPNPSFYVATTKLVPRDKYPMAFTLGLGNNDFAKVNEDKDKKDKVYPFASGAIYIKPQISLIADYTSNIVTLGVGLVPFPKAPISMTLGLYDVGKERTDNEMSFVGSIAMSFSF
jgi:hypothetical protein